MAAAEQKWKPLLTDTEQDEQYWAVINQGRQDMDASGGVNSVCFQISLVLFICLAVARVFEVHAAGCLQQFDIKCYVSAMLAVHTHNGAVHAYHSSHLSPGKRNSR